MNYTNLGSSGLRVSRVCLGMMGFGNDSDRAWVIDEDAAEPIVACRGRGWRHLLRHRRRVFGRGQRGGDRAAGAASSFAATRPSSRPRCSCPSPRGRTAAGSTASTCSRASMRRSGASAWTTSTSIRSTGGTRGLRSRRRWRRSTTSCGPVRRVTSERAPCSRGSSPRPSTPPSGTGGRRSCPCRTTTT